VTAAARGLRRPDGPAKLTGAAVYTADTEIEGVTHAVLVPASVPSGRIAHIDTAMASAAPGVLAVLTHVDMPRLNLIGTPPLGQSALPLQDEWVRYEGQPVAMVVADTAERAHHAAGLVGVAYADVAGPPAFGAGEPVTPVASLLVRPRRMSRKFNAEALTLKILAGAAAVASSSRRWLTGNWLRALAGPDDVVGDIDAGLAGADAVVTAAYTTPDRHHNPIEPSATLADWDGDQLNVRDATQWVFGTRMVLAAAFGLPADHVRVMCPYIGGGFGCKAFVWPHTLLTAAAARVTGRPVKLVLTRAQMFTSCGHQPTTRQTVTLGATRDGRLTAIRHHSVNPTSTFDDYAENATEGTRWMYASPAIAIATRVQRTNRPTPTPMRAPGEGVGMFALESAMDELAYSLDIDPVELRLRNEPAVDPMTGRPFSSRPFTECLRRAAERFGWSGRTREPGSMRDGDQLIGWGMAAITMNTFRMPSSARVRVHADGRTVVEVGTQEIGTGLPGIVTMIAAETLGVDPGRSRYATARPICPRPPARSDHRRPWAWAPQSQPRPASCGQNWTRPARPAVTPPAWPRQGWTRWRLRRAGTRPNGAAVARSTPTARSSSRSGWTPTSGLSGCHAVSLLTPPGGSLTRSPRAARSSGASPGDTARRSWKLRSSRRNWAGSCPRTWPVT
jgi:xanthine dehydrogenase YagR molybdenum-binding subunit